MPKYQANEVEKKWQSEWIKRGTYRFDLNAPGEIFSIDNPPSFTSGTLHMGHVLNHSWIDFIARYKRMRGYNVLFPLGFDCHGLPTELKVTKEYGLQPSQLKEFRAKCEEWTTYAAGKMKEQYLELGYSADWDQYYETRDPKYKAAVQYSLIKNFEAGILTREKHPILWCTKCLTALAKAEVGHIEKAGNLWYLQFDINDSDKKAVIATTRPEMLYACIAIMANPEDERFKDIIGKTAIIPYVDRDVPILADKNVDSEFGTGLVYVCTFGDEMDINWQKTHDLPFYEAVDSYGKMTELCQEFAGLKVVAARKMIVEKLEKDGYLIKTEDKPHNVLCHTERGSCQNPVELIPRKQFFIKVKDYLPKIVEAANEMKWYPSYMKQRLIDWTESLTWDWIISRQRAYGTPIPFWYCDDCGQLIPASEENLPVDTTIDDPPVSTCPKCSSVNIKGTTDVCDCWIDSSITPLMVARWTEDPEFFDKVWPVSLRPQGYEIIRTWAFYTIFRSLTLTGQKPFDEVVVNGMVAGTDGRKMSKSLGNMVSPEVPLEKYGSDATRQWALNASLGEDYPFSDKELIYSQKFLNKYWNAVHFAMLHLKDYTPKKPVNFRPIDKWILSRLNSLIKENTEHLDKYEFAKALTSTRTFFWHEFCDFYLEIAKDRLYNASGDEKESAQYCLYQVLLNVSLMLAPFIPHITDEVHELYLKGYTGSDSIHLAKWPDSIDEFITKDAEEKGELITGVISSVRKFKTDNGIALNAEFSTLTIQAQEDLEAAKDIKEAIKAKEIKFTTDKQPIEVSEDVSINVVK